MSAPGWVAWGTLVETNGFREEPLTYRHQKPAIMHENGPHTRAECGPKSKVLHCRISRQGLLTRARDGEDPGVH
jgi:hypothetical protein